MTREQFNKAVEINNQINFNKRGLRFVSNRSIVRIKHSNEALEIFEDHSPELNQVISDYYKNKIKDLETEFDNLNII